MKGRGTIKLKEKTAKRLEKINRRAAQAVAREARQRVYAEANGEPWVAHHTLWQRTHFYLSAIERKCRAAEQQMLATTSLKDLIK
jgi:hypothetical protein